jgi:hypothetical protein
MTIDPHEQRRTCSNYWFNCAFDLYGAAAAVWCSHTGVSSAEIVEHCTLEETHGRIVGGRGVYLMLCGMALELMYKATAVAMKRSVRPTHDLLALAKDVEIAVKKQDEGLLKILTHAIEWEGRYPIPKARKRSAFDEVRTLWLTHLSDAEATGSFTIRKTNKRLDWAGFKRLWLAANERYWHEYWLGDPTRSTRLRPQR